MISWSSDDFLISGLTKAFLYDDGTTPVDKERLISLVKDGSISGRHFFRRSIGSGSRAHVTLLDLLINSVTSFSVAGLSLLNLAGHGVGFLKLGRGLHCVDTIL